MTEPGGETRRAAGVRVVAILYVLVALGLRAATILRSRYNTDEPQHLHVAWEWTQGLIPYRDFYDNHLPLFHMLVAPWLAAVGETPHILFYARLVMLPLLAAILVLTWKLAAELYDRSVAWWATLAAVFMPPLLRPTAEFRNDSLWLVLLLLSLLFMFRGRWLLAGVVLGTSLMVSIKTAPFALALGLSLLVTGYGRLLPLIAGSTIAPVLVTSFFAFHGAADEMFRWSVFSNGTMPVDPSRRIAGLISCLTIASIAIFFARRSSRGPQVVARLIPVLYIAVFVAISPLIGPRDFLPVYVLGLIWLFSILAPRTRHFVMCAGFVIAFDEARLWLPQSPEYPQIIADTLRYTSPADRVFDQKGEMVFRRRATYLVLESVSQKRLAIGALRDTIAADMIRARAYASVRDSVRIPPASRRFLNRYFVPFGAIRVAGQRVRRDGTFEIAIPGPYTILRQGRVVVPSRWYAPGRYRAPAGAVALWSGALRRVNAPQSSRQNLTSGSTH